MFPDKIHRAGCKHMKKAKDKEKRKKGKHDTLSNQLI